MTFAFDGSALVFEGSRIAASMRTFSQMRPVLAHPEKECGIDPDEPAYYMYRAAAKFKSLRYDITRITPLDLCGERCKTYGHAHPKSQKGASWPEIYEVLAGSAHFLLQRVNELGVDDAVLLSAKKGECLLIPPGYGHVTINEGKTELVLANIVSDRFEADYSTYTNHRGACFYENTKGEIVRNKNYGIDFELRKDTAVKFSSAFAAFAPFRKGNILAAAKNWENISFLDKPEEFY